MVVRHSITYSGREDLSFPTTAPAVCFGVAAGVVVVALVLVVLSFLRTRRRGAETAQPLEVAPPPSRGLQEWSMLGLPAMYMAAGIQITARILIAAMVAIVLKCAAHVMLHWQALVILHIGIFWGAVAIVMGVFAVGFLLNGPWKYPFRDIINVIAWVSLILAMAMMVTGNALIWMQAVWATPLQSNFMGAVLGMYIPFAVFLLVVAIITAIIIARMLRTQRRFLTTDPFETCFPVGMCVDPCMMAGHPTVHVMQSHMSMAPPPPPPAAMCGFQPYIGSFVPQ